MSRAILAIAILSSMVTTSCFQMGTSQLGSAVLRNGQGAATQLKTETSNTGATTATVDANSHSTQLISAAESSSVKGSSISFPPGSLAISTSITLEEGASVATPAFAAELSLGTDLTKSGTAVTVNAATATDAKLPFKLSIPLPVSLGLAEDWSNLVVLYKVTVVSGGTNVIGVIPRSEIEIKDGLAQISTQYFGSFQTAITKDVVAEKKEQSTKSMILTKQESQSLAPVAVSSRLPFIVKSKGSIEINGINFRQTMVVAMGGVKVAGLKVLSDSRASFIAPTLSSYGLTTVSVEQDGVAQSISVFYAGEKADLPISTKAESEICAGEKYYDANGAIRTGVRVCNAVVNGSVPDLTNLVAANIKLGVSINGVQGTLVAGSSAACSTDGQTDCVAVAGYPAMNASIAAPKILTNQSLGGISGTAQVRPANCSTEGGVDCVAVSAFPAVNKANLVSNAYKIYKLVNIAGIQGTLLDCVEGSSNCYAISGTAAVSISSLQPANIKNGFTIANVTGSFGPDCTTDNQMACLTSMSYPSVAKAGFSEWDLRSGKTVAGVSGKIVFSQGKASLGFSNRTTGTGAESGADIYDTVIDGLMPLDAISGFVNATTNLVAHAGIDTNNNGICDAGESCVYTDKISGLSWTKESTNTSNWDNGINYCATLSAAGFSNGWRLPTHKELMQAHINGLYDLFFELDLSNPVWTATTSSTQTNAVVFTPSDASTSTVMKTSGQHHSICVR